MHVICWFYVPIFHECRHLSNTNGFFNIHVFNQSTNASLKYFRYSYVLTDAIAFLFAQTFPFHFQIEADKEQSHHRLYSILARGAEASGAEQSGIEIRGYFPHCGFRMESAGYNGKTSLGRACLQIERRI